MFRKLWNWAQNNAGAIIGGAIGGPVGIVIGALIDAAIAHDWSGGELKSNIPPHVQAQVDEFAEKYVKPIITEYLESLGAATTTADLVKTYHVNKLNEAIKKLATLQAYHEFTYEYLTTNDEMLLYGEIVEGLGHSIQTLNDVYAEATRGIYNSHTPATITFTPSTITNVAGLRLDWRGAKVTGNYTGYKTEEEGTIVQPPPPPPYTTTKPTTGDTINPTTGGTAKPTTGGTTSPTKPGAITTTTTPVAVVQAESNNNKKYWIMGTALAVAALIFRR